MTDQTDNLIYNISIYHLDNQFYITPMVRMPPIGMRTQVLPLYIVPDTSIEKISEAIEAAKLKSDLIFHMEQTMPKQEEWDGDNERVWNTAQKSWDVFWKEDGAVDIDFAKPYVKHKNGVEWIYVKEAEKILPPPVSSKDIAQEITNQVQ